MSKTRKQQQEFDASQLRSVPRDPEDSEYALSFTTEQVDEAHEFFQEHGFVVLRDVLSAEEAEATVGELWHMLETRAGYVRDDPSTWNGWPEDGIVQYGSPQRAPIMTPQFLANRQNAGLHKVVSQLMGTSRVVINHDRGCLFRPACASYSKRKWATRTNLHLDINPWQFLDGEASDFYGKLDELRYKERGEFIFENNRATASDGMQIQGVINLVPNVESDGGFWCVPGFHHVFEDVFGDGGTLGVPVDRERPSVNFPKKHILYARYAKRVPMRPGSVVLWDQRLPHGSVANRSDRIRSAQFFKFFRSDAIRSQARRTTRRKALLQAIREASTQGFELSSTGRIVFDLDET